MSITPRQWATVLEQLNQVAGRVEEQDRLAPGPSAMSLRNRASGSIVVVWFRMVPSRFVAS
jgi:hypothetical protein